MFIHGFLHVSVLQGSSSDQKAVARYKVGEEARKGSKGETVREHEPVKQDTKFLRVCGCGKTCGVVGAQVHSPLVAKL